MREITVKFVMDEADANELLHLIETEQRSGANVEVLKNEPQD